MFFLLKRLHGDNSDMMAWGFFLDEDGRIFQESMWNYMDLEYYRGTFENRMRLLVAISNFVKGEISLDLLLSAHRKITMDEMDRDTMLGKWYTEEGVKLAGLDGIVAKK